MSSDESHGDLHCRPRAHPRSVGYEVTGEIVHHLMDGVDPDDLDAARSALDSVEELTQPQLRGRWMGRSLMLEVEAHLHPATTVAAADLIAHQVEEAVRTAVPAVRQVRFTPRAARRG